MRRAYESKVLSGEFLIEQKDDDKHLLVEIVNGMQIEASPQEEGKRVLDLTVDKVWVGRSASLAA